MTVIGIDETDESMELNELKERANKLSEQLKMLNTSEDNSEVSSMVEINEDEPTIVEAKEENKAIEKEEDQSSEAKDNVKVMNNETTPKKQRSFVKLLNKSDLGDSLEEVNNILVGIEQDLASNVEAESDSKQCNQLSDDEGSNESSEKTWNPHKPKKAISFCLPDIPPVKADSIEQDSPSDDKAVIDDESSYSDDISDKNEMFTEVSIQNKRIDEKAKQIEKSLGNISKQKYFSNKDSKKVKEEAQNNSVSQMTKKPCWPVFEQRQVYAYPDYNPTVYRY